MLKLCLCKTYAEAIVKAGKVAADFGNSLDKKLYAFCEDKLTMSLEAEIARAMGGGTFSVQVTSFSRFIHRHSRAACSVLDKESSAMVVKRILLSEAEHLTCFKRSAHSPGTAVTLYELIAQLKSAGVSPDDLKNGAAELDGALRGKIKDIVRVYRLYEEYIESRGLYDSNSYLALMPELVKKGSFKGCSAMLVGFSSMTRQGMEIVSALADEMEDLWVFTLSGENEELYLSELKTQLMREIGGFYVEESAVSYGKERDKIMSSMFEPTVFSYKNSRVETDKIFIYEASDSDDELEHIAQIIRREAVGGIRYKDIAVAVGNPTSYSGSIARIFADYEIPYFLDDPRPLSSHPLARLAVEWLDVIKNRFSVESVLSLIRNPYYTVDKSACDRIEQFILRNALTPSIIKNGLNPTLIPHYGEGVDLFEECRASLVKRVKEYSTCGDYSSAIIALMQELGVEEKSEVFAKRLEALGNFAEAAFTRQAYQKTVAVLNSVSAVLENSLATAGEYKGILLSGLSACKVSLLPQLSDAVYVGDYKECKYLAHKILFAAGLNGEVPFTKSDTAVLNDRDLNKLEKFGCIVEPKIKIVNRREKENVGASLVSFTDRLYLSRSSFGSDGKPLSKGRIIDYFTACFSKGGKPLAPTSAVELGRMGYLNHDIKRELCALKFSAKRPAMQQFVTGSAQFKEGAKTDYVAESTYLSAVKECSPDQASLAEDLLKGGGVGLAQILPSCGELIMRRDELSASILEQYFGCPFACFMQSGLKLKEREDGSMQKNEFGNLLHAVLEDFVRLLLTQGENGEKYAIKATSVEKIIADLMQRREQEFVYGRYLERGSYKELFALTQKEAVRVATYILNTLNASAFRPIEVEAAFGKGKKYKPISLSTPYGVKKIVGKIDRVDAYGDYIRVIDYKTGAIYAEDEYFYTGNHVQLYLYMNALIGEGQKPAGAYYFPVHDELASDTSGAYAMKGKTLLDRDVILASDPNAQNGKESAVLTAKFTDKNGEISATKNMGLSDEELSAYLKYALKIAEKGAEEISEGVIAPSPYEGRCRICRYASVCGFDPDVDGERKEDSVNIKTIVSAAEVENG